MKIGRHEIDISNREKVFFPESGITKGDLIDYYQVIADVMLPHMQDYAVSMQRFPDGLEADGFFNKDAPDYFPDWIDRVHFPKREGGSFEAPIVGTTSALVYLADQAVITFHRYLARCDDLEKPDKMIYDLDPPEGIQDYQSVREAALDLRSVLEEIDLTSFVQTTGSEGFHVVVPLDREQDFDGVREFATDLARVLVSRHSDKYTLEQRKKKREGRIFLDMLRNAYGATSVAPYSVRALPGAPVATPITWDELQDGASPRDWTLENIKMRLGQMDDPWSGIMLHAQSIKSRRSSLKALLDGDESST
ncbi:MAG: non-homologous end-joining DNA ligase [Anaerolineales bacterium]|jgi:bifunctional non-homologous end joining protein LigD